MSTKADGAEIVILSGGPVKATQKGKRKSAASSTTGAKAKKAKQDEMETPKRPKEEVKAKDVPPSNLEIATKKVGQGKGKNAKAVKKAKDSESSEDETDSSDDSEDSELSSEESSEESDNSDLASSDDGEEGGSTKKKEGKKGEIYKDLLHPTNYAQIILAQCKQCREGQKEETEPVIATEKMGMVAKFLQCGSCIRGNQALAQVVKQFYGKDDTQSQMTTNYRHPESDDYKGLAQKYVTIYGQCKYCKERQGRYVESGAEYCRKKGPKPDTEFLLLATCTSCNFANKTIQQKYWSGFSLYGNKDAKDNKAEEELQKLKKELSKMKKASKKAGKKAK